MATITREQERRQSVALTPNPMPSARGERREALTRLSHQPGFDSGKPRDQSTTETRLMSNGRHDQPGLPRAGGLGLAALLLTPLAMAQPEPLRVEIVGQAERGLAQPVLDLPAATGSRLELTPRLTPAAVDVITRERLRERGQHTTQAALENAVGVTTGQCFGFTCFSMRGFSDVLSVPLMYDGLRIPGLAMSPRSTFVYDRIEVIRGPASVLHGLGTIGGAVNFVTHRATGREERELLLSLDRWRTVKLGVGLGGAWSEDLAYRLDLSAIDAERGSAGWVERTDYRNLHGAGEVAWRLSPALRLTLSAQWLDDRGRWYFGTPLVGGRLDRRVRERNYNVEDSLVSKRIGWLRAGVEYAFSPGLTLRNETYVNDEQRRWRNAERYAFNPATGRVDLSDFLRIDHDQGLVGNRTELVLRHRPLGLDSQLVVGLDGSRNRHTRTNNSPFRAPPTAVDFLDPTPPRFATDSPFLPVRRTVLDQQALYAESLLGLGAQLRLSLAARHDRIDLDSLDLRQGARFDRRWHANSWRIGAVHELTPTLALYAQTSRALKPAAQVVTLTPAQRDFALASARQAEVGIKGDLPGGAGEFTLSAFRIVRLNMLTRDPARPGETIQIGEQSSRGVEFSVVWHPHADWALGVDGAWLRPRFDRFYEPADGVAVSRAGLRPPDVAERVANLYADWRPGPDWRLHAGLRHVGARYGNNANTIVLPAYTTLNLGVTRRLTQGELALRVRNATDRVYLSRSYGPTQALLGEPRALELAYTLRF